MKVNCTNVKLDIIGIATHYDEMRVLPGGVKRWVKNKHVRPKVEASFRAEVDVVLQSGAVYSNGNNFFRALSANVIVNEDRHLDSFSIPVQLDFVGHPEVGQGVTVFYSEGVKDMPKDFTSVSVNNDKP